ncbi:hypothetical protein LDO32_01455 [Luteimonas sp. Y-2-2-4F]|nr:hypothetical protein [Luteimonas sp. Y-2-2-4F]MCD9030401.1 hypothetical protein [Luteimonas sp. Y-2-2-4F]
MRSALTTLLALLCAPALAQEAPAPAPPAGDPVAVRLAERGIEYDIDQDGDYRVVYSWAREERSQLVFVSGRAEEVAGQRIRMVFSPAARLDGDLDGAVANGLLRDNQTRKLGAWEISGDVLYYVVKLPEDADAAMLELAMSAAAEIADDKELEMTGGQDAL